MINDATSTVDPIDAVRPRVALACIATSFSGDPLDKAVGNWKVWSSKIRDNLAICGLGGHIKELKAGTTRSNTRPRYPPACYDNRITNDATKLTQRHKPVTFQKFLTPASLCTNKPFLARFASSCTAQPLIRSW